MTSDVSSPDALTKLCSNCGFRLEASLLRCPLDGLPLGPSRPENEILGPYRLIRRLGRGGMGVVYQAENERLGRYVAIKLLHRGLHGDKVVVDRFFLEARAVNTIRHPHVVETYDLVSGPDDLYMVMEYLEGEDLAALLGKSVAQPWPVPRVMHVLEQICGALQATHRRGIIHRDLKPANVFLTHRRGMEDFVKVLDFGIVKLAADGGRLTLEGLTMGTPEYMSPEQVCGDETLDGRSDLYGLGCIAFEMLTGYQLFGGGSHGDVMLAQLHKPPSSLRQWNKNVSLALDAVILRCLAKDASERPSSAYLLARELAEATGRPFDVTGAFMALTPNSLAIPNVITTGEMLTGPGPVVRPSPSVDDVEERVQTALVRVGRDRRWRWAAAVAGAAGAIAAMFWAARTPVLVPEPSVASTVADVVRVQLQTQPPGAQVVDVRSGEVWGTTPLERGLPRLSHQHVRFELAGHEVGERRFEVKGVSAVVASLAPTVAAPDPDAQVTTPGEKPKRRLRASAERKPGARTGRVGAGTIDPFSP